MLAAFIDVDDLESAASLMSSEDQPVRAIADTDNDLWIETGGTWAEHLARLDRLVECPECGVSYDPDDTDSSTSGCLCN